MASANGWKPLTITKKNSTQDCESPRSDSDNNKNGI